MALTSTDLDRLIRVQHAVLMPLAYPHPQAWMDAIREEMERLFEAERAVCVLGLAGDALYTSSGLSPQALVEYETEFAAHDSAGELVISNGKPYYVEEDFYEDERFRAHTASVVYNEWYRAHGQTDALGIIVRGHSFHVPGLYAQQELPIVANFLLTGTSMCRGEGAEKARSMLSLLQPAVAVAARTWQERSLASHRAVATVEGLDAAAWLYDSDGRLLHEASRARGILEQGGEPLRFALNQFVRALLAAQRMGEPVTPAVRIRTGGTLLTLYGAFLPANGPGDPAVLVRVEGAAPPLPTPEDLRQRFELTPQEARVALLRARGESTAAIAERLSVSVNTVRRHTEHAMGKLNVHRAAEIGPYLLALKL